MISIKELKEYLQDNVDEVQFLELLDITTVELTEAFENKIADKADFLIEKLELNVDSNTNDSSDSL